MSVAVAACLWLVAANVAGMIPSRTGHRRRVVVLIVTALPMAAWVFAALARAASTSQNFVRAPPLLHCTDRFVARVKVRC